MIQEASIEEPVIPWRVDVGHGAWLLPRKRCRRQALGGMLLRAGFCDCLTTVRTRKGIRNSRVNHLQEDNTAIVYKQTLSEYISNVSKSFFYVFLHIWL